MKMSDNHKRNLFMRHTEKGTTKKLGASNTGQMVAWRTARRHLVSVRQRVRTGLERRSVPYSEQYKMPNRVPRFPLDSGTEIGRKGYGSRPKFWGEPADARMAEKWRSRSQYGPGRREEWRFTGNLLEELKQMILVFFVCFFLFSRSWCPAVQVMRTV